MGPATPEAQAAAKQIENLIATFGRLPTKLTQEEAKKLIQQIDRSEQAVYRSGEFTDDVAGAYKSLRAQLDEQLKTQNPAYKEAMVPVAENTRLHGEVLPSFGDRESSISTLNRIGSPTSQVQRENLSKLGKATGRDYDTPIKEYMDAQSTLKKSASDG